MITCKLEYMIKNIDIKPWKRLVFLIDKDSQFEFHEYYIEKLKEFKKRIPVEGDSKNIEVWRYKNAKRSDQQLRLQYENIFKEINQICIENRTYPIFKDPSNIEECLETRKDLLAIKDEKVINEFFGVNSFTEYTPPIYIEPSK